MKTRVYIGLCGALLMLLAGCGGGGSGFDPDADPAQDDVEVIFGAERDSDPADLQDADALGAEIDWLFGDENAETVDLEASDSTVDVLDRARNG